MVKDEDATPVALRAALLRRSTTPERAKTSKSKVLSLVLACICVAAAASLWHLWTFENVADLCFFGGIAWPLDLWLATHAADATVLELPCNQISRVYAAQQPIIFRSCIPEGVGLADIGYFPDEKQNLFTPCEVKLIRDFEFVDVNNNTKAIVEQVPCSPSTLRDKIDAFHAHDIRRHGNYFEVHTRMATTRRERALLDESFHTKLKLNLTVERMTAATVTHFFHAGRTAVYYLHAHLDRFMSFCLQEEKKWTLISPRYHKHFVSTWSGNAQMMLREKQEAPRLEVTQRRGDILFVPPWWMHETRVQPYRKNLGVNVHWTSPGQLVGYAASLHARLGNPSWFYS